MKKKILALLLALMMLCPLLVACSSHYDYDSYKDFIVLGDVSKIEISEADIEFGILGIYYDYFSDEIDAKTLTSKVVTSGTVEYGDTVNIDYKGYKLGETEPFEGGSTYDDDGNPSGEDLEIGSGSYIEGFETGLIGHEIGETVALYLTFPETYGEESLAGQKARFDVVINKVSARYDYPEMTNEKIKEQSSGEFSTVAEFRASAREDTIKNLIWADYYQLCKVKEWPKKELEDYYYNALDNYKSYATMMGTTFDTYATYMGYSDGDGLRKSVMQQARQQCKQDLMVLAIIEANKLEMSDDKLEKAMKAIWKESGSEDSYREYLKNNEESAVRIAAYTDVAMEHLMSKVSPTDNWGSDGSKFKNGFYGTASSGVRYFINGVMQTGWQQIDLDGDGTADTYFFNPELDGRAYLNIAVKMKANGSETEQFLEFGDKGIFKGVVNNKVVFTKLTTAESDKGGYAYIVNDNYTTGVQYIDRTTAISGVHATDKNDAKYATEQYLFGEDGYMYLGVKKLENFGVLDFGSYNGKYYNFGTSGLLNFNLDTKENGLYGDASTNGLANGLIDEKAYKDGDMIVSDTYTDSSNNVYYFDENGDMAKAKFVVIDNNLYYFDNGGKMLKSQEIQIDDILYKIDENGVAEATCAIEGVSQKNTAYTDNAGNVYYFDADGKMVRSQVVDNVTVSEVAAKRYFDEYGKMLKATAEEETIVIRIGDIAYTIDTNGAIISDDPASAGE